MIYRAPASLLSSSRPLLVAALCLTACGGGDSSETAGADAGVDCETETFYPDVDQDGFGDDSGATEACAAPDNYVSVGGDCNDDSAESYPGAEEVCDGLDNDCDGLVDSADPDVDVTAERDYYRDADDDGFGNIADTQSSCDQPAGYVANSDDCNDSRADVSPTSPEVCDGVDNDCDLQVDQNDSDLDTSTAIAQYRDQDADGFGAGAVEYLCSQAFGYSTLNTDCDDGDGSSYPGATELCDGADNDCNGSIDTSPAFPNACQLESDDFSFTYRIRAQEKLGNSVINDMHCQGSGTLSYDPTQSPPISGTATCSYPAGLTLFDNTQTATLAGNLALDGSVSLVVTHRFSNDSFSPIVRTYTVTGDLADGEALSGVGSLLPHPMSAVPWVVTIGGTFSAE